MPRYRTIKPEFFDDEKMAELSEGAALLYIGMWCFGDDEGIIRSGTSWLKSKIFPHKKSLKLSKVDGFLTELRKLARIHHFTYNGEGYFIITNFLNHQRIDKPQASKLPKVFINEIRGTLLEGSQSIPPLNQNHNQNQITSSKEDVGKTSFAPTEKQQEDFKAFTDWMLRHTPDVLTMKKPITIEQYLTMKGEMFFAKKKNEDGTPMKIPGIPKKIVEDTLMDLQNKTSYRKTFESPYYCIKRWHDRDKNKK